MTAFRNLLIPLCLLMVGLPLAVFAQEGTEEPPVQDDAERDAAVAAVKLDQEVTFLDGLLTFSMPEGWVAYEVPLGETPAIMFAPNDESLLYLGALIDMTFDEIITNLDPEATVEPAAEPVQPENFVFGIIGVQSRADLGPQGELTFEDLAADMENGTMGELIARREFEVDGYPALLLIALDDSGDLAVPEGGSVYGFTALIDFGSHLVIVFGGSAAPLDETIAFEAILRSVQLHPDSAPQATTEP